jgi:hypothetical protein
MDVVVASEAATDFVVEGSLVLSGARGGLALRLDDDGCGLFIELTPESGQIELQRWGFTRNERHGGMRYAYDVLQSSHRSIPIHVGNPIPFRLLSVGPYVEASFGGEVAIATMTGSPAAGAWGIWVEDGSCTVSDLRWAPMQRPGSAGRREMNPSVEVVSVG